MAKKRKEGIDLEISNINDDPRIFVERNEIMKLTKVAKSWEFTCSFCFKKFPSAQAMGGHQNAHRSERLEEKRLFVRDPIGYRKRAYLRAMKAMDSSAESSGSGGAINLHATSKMVKHDLTNVNGPPKNLKRPAFLSGDFGDFNTVIDAHENNNNNNKDSLALDINGENNSKKMCVVNFLPPKELNLAESVGIHADVKDKAAACIDLDTDHGVYGINLEKLDLTLKL